MQQERYKLIEEQFDFVWQVDQFAFYPLIKFWEGVVVAVLKGNTVH